MLVGFFGVALLVACQLVVGVRERILEEGGAVDAGPTPRDDTGCGDLQSSPMNCGFCGHVCDGCANGLCPVETLIRDIPFPRGLAVDDQSYYVLTNKGLNVYSRQTLALVASHAAGDNPRDLVVADGKAYWATDFPAKWHVTDGSGTRTLFVSPDNSRIDQGVIRDGVLLWVTGRDGVRQVQTDGGAFKVVVPDGDASTAYKNQIAVTDEEIFAACHAEGWVRRWPRAGGPATAEFPLSGCYAFGRRGDARRRQRPGRDLERRPAQAHRHLRWTLERLEGADELPGVPGFVCGSSPSFALLQSVVCTNLDITTLAKDDNRDALCDAISIGLRFEAIEARFGPIVPHPPDKRPCGDTWVGKCPNL